MTRIRVLRVPTNANNADGIDNLTCYRDDYVLWLLLLPYMTLQSPKPPEMPRAIREAGLSAGQAPTPPPGRETSPRRVPVCCDRTSA